MKPRSSIRRSALAVSWLVALAGWTHGCRVPPDSEVSRPEDVRLERELERFILREIRQKGIPALSIALVEGEEIVWARGFGEADPGKGKPATKHTVYRVGSVSKLVTDIAILQLVERGELELDAPVTDILELAPRNRWGKPVTLRQLMSHRSGLVREPPVGSYFDPTEPTLGETVRSLDATELVYEPGTREKYSNAGVAVAGRVLEVVRGRPFADIVRDFVLEPLGMEETAFDRRSPVAADLARAVMWTRDGRTFPAPVFDLGTSPAGNMYSTVHDLARFLAAILNGGRGRHGRVLRPETLEEMWTPQYAEAGERTGFGLGFYVSMLDGHRRVGHNGAVYGFSTTLAALPDERLGAVAAASLDGTNAVVQRIVDAALRALLARRHGRAPALPPSTRPVHPSVAATVAGRWGHAADSFEIERRGDRLLLDRGERLVELRAAGEDLIVDGRLAHGPKLELEREGNAVGAVVDAIVIGSRTYRRKERVRPAPAPERFGGLIGEYGEDHNVLYIREKDGTLHALIEWFFDYPLEKVSRNEFAFPAHGLYHGERLLFERDAQGRALRVVAAGVPFERRDPGAQNGETFRIEPLRPPSELREAALSARPPREEGPFRPSELVELADLDPAIRYDIRYATTNNFMGAVFYKEPRAFLQRPAAEALVRAHRRLMEKGYGVLIHDAYRPWHVTKMFWDATPPELRDFVADPSKGSRHNRGAAVDLTLYDLENGAPVRMVSGYDEFSARSNPYYPGGTALERWHRDLLRRTMEAEGFTVYEHEWWHFDHRDWREYPILDRTFDELGEE